MDLKGNIEDVGLPLILQTINLGNMTGTLTLSRDSDMGHIYFRNGRVIFADSSANRVRLGEILIEQGRLSEQDISRILKKQSKTGKKIGQLLQESGKISADEVALCLGFQAEDIVFQLLSWGSGKYMFQKDELPDDILVHLAEQTSSLISEGKDQIEELFRIRESIPSMNLVLELNPISDKNEKEKVVDLTIDEWQVLSLVDGNKSVTEICELNPANTFTTCRILNDLIAFDVIKSQTVRLFEQQIDDSSQHLLKLSTMLSIYNQAFVSIFTILLADIGNEATRTFRECLKDAKIRFTALLHSLELNQSGSFNHLHLMQNILSLPPAQQIPSLRNGLNAFLANIVIKLKDQFGKKRYHQVVRQVYSDMEILFETDTKLREEVKKNLDTVVAHTNQIPSSFKLAMKYYNDHKFDLAFKHFNNIPSTNPNYKKTQSYIKKIFAVNPELQKLRKPLAMTQPIHIEDQPSESVQAITETDKPDKAAIRSRVVKDLLKGLKLYSQDKFEEAIKILDSVLLAEPLNAKAAQFRDLSQKQLAQSYEARIGSLDAVPILNSEINDDKLEELTLSPHEGYLLSRVNGNYSINDIISISGVDTYSALKMFHTFIAKKLVIMKQKHEKPAEPEPEMVEVDNEKVEEQNIMGYPEVDPACLKTNKINLPHSQKVRTRVIDRKKLAEQHYNMGKKACEKGEYVRAVEELEAAILNNPNNPHYYNLLAEAREKKRNSESDNFYQSGMQELKQKNYGKAIRFFKKSLVNAPRNIECLLTLAEVLSKVPGKKEEAIMYFKKALESQPNNMEIIIKIGRLYGSMGEKELAMSAFRNCLTLDSSNQVALRELRKLQLGV